MSQVKGFKFNEALAQDVREQCPLATGHQGFPPGDVVDLQHFLMDPAVGVAHWIWSLWPQLGLGSRWLGWDFGPGSSSGDGTPLGAFFTVRPQCINRPCCSRGKSSLSLNGLSPGKEESHTCGQCRFTAQLFVDVKLDLLIGFFFSWGGGSTLPCPTPGVLSLGL